jgi:zona occludens toxin
LVDDHVHVMRVMGSESAMVYRWNEVQTDPRSESAKTAALVTPWAYPKSAYQVYSSAVMHTTKRRLPWRKLALVAMLLIVPLLGWLAFSLLPGQSLHTEEASVSKPDSAQPKQVRPVEINSAEQWLARYEPRVSYRPESAPAYDGFMSEAKPPRLFCIDVELKGCTCYTEQATVWAGIASATCKRLAKNGLYEPRV